MTGINYAVVVEGRVIGARTSKGHREPIYTHAVVDTGTNPGVLSYHTNAALASKAMGTYRSWGRATMQIVPVVTTARRATIGEVVQ